MLSDQGEMHGHQTAKYTLNRQENCGTGMHSKREKAIAPDDFSPGKINWNVLEPKNKLSSVKIDGQASWKANYQTPQNFEVPK